MRSGRGVRVLRVFVTVLALTLVVAGTMLAIKVQQRRQGTFGHACAASSRLDLDAPEAAPVARMLVSSAENSSLAWENQVGYLEYNVEHVDSENRGYTGGIIGFTSKTGDMLEVVGKYAARNPRAKLASYLAALKAVNGTASRAGLGDSFEHAWAEAAEDDDFKQAQLEVADEDYLRPAVEEAREDGLGRLGQYLYYDAIVMHGPGVGPRDFGGIRAEARRHAKPPSAGGQERHYLEAFLDARVAAMRTEKAHSDVSRVDDAQRRFLKDGNFTLDLPLEWNMYGDHYVIAQAGTPRCWLRF